MGSLQGTKHKTKLEAKLRARLGAKLGTKQGSKQGSKLGAKQGVKQGVRKAWRKAFWRSSSEPSLMLPFALMHSAVKNKKPHIFYQFGEKHSGKIASHRLLSHEIQRRKKIFLRGIAISKHCISFCHQRYCLPQMGLF